MCMMWDQMGCSRKESDALFVCVGFDAGRSREEDIRSSGAVNARPGTDVAGLRTWKEQTRHDRNCAAKAGTAALVTGLTGCCMG